MKGILCLWVLLLPLITVAQQSTDKKSTSAKTVPAKPPTVDDENAARLKPLLIGATITTYSNNSDSSYQMTITDVDMSGCSLCVRQKSISKRSGFPDAIVDSTETFGLLDIDTSGIFIKRNGSGFNVFVPAIDDADRVTLHTLSIDNIPNGLTLKHSWTDYGFAEAERAKRFVTALRESVLRCRQINKP